MKRFLCMFLVALTMFGCDSMNVNRSEESVTDSKLSDEFSCKAGVESAEIKWSLQNTGEVDKIEIASKQNVGKIYKVIKEVKSEVNSIEIPLTPFLEFDVRARVILKNGMERNSYEFKGLVARMKNVIIDKVDGREMQIYLPDGYEASNERYPVVYMHDGQNLFNKKTAPNGEWQVDETMAKLIKEERIEKMIVVGIYNSGNRADEYVPYPIEEMPGQGGDADKFAEFVVKKVVPYIDNNYRTIPNRENRAVMGSSFGGILSFWMGLKYADVFSAIGAFSPSLWVSKGKFLVELGTLKKQDMKIWIDVGTMEYDLRDRVAIDILVEKGYKYGKDIFYYEDKGAEHNEAAWAARMAYPLIMFKGKNKNPKIVDYELKIEKIPSVGIKNIDYHIIVNPMAEFDDGMKYTLLEGVTYTVDKGKVEENFEIILENQENNIKDSNNKFMLHLSGNINMGKEKEITVMADFKGIRKSTLINEAAYRNK